MTCLSLLFFSNLVTPEYSAFDANQQVDTGYTFFLNLSLDARPQVNNFSWTRNNVPYIGNVTATSIFIAKANRSDAGNYMVTATNDVGSTNTTFNLTVFCKFCVVIHN